MEPKSFPTLRTDRLLLRQIKPDDITHIYDGLSHPDVIQYYGVSYGSLSETAAQIAWYDELEQNETGIWWAVCSRDNRIFHGAGGFNNWNKDHRKAEIGFWLLPQFWGSGFMQEAFPVLCDFGFQTLDLHRIEGFVEPANTPCKRAIEKLGFTHEGTMRECEMKAGQFLDVDIYAKLKTD